jgi:hypothetical protein
MKSVCHRLSYRTPEDRKTLKIEGSDEGAPISALVRENCHFEKFGIDTMKAS